MHTKTHPCAPTRSTNSPQTPDSDRAVPELGRRQAMMALGSAGFLAACSGTGIGVDDLLPGQPGSGTGPSPVGPGQWATGGTQSIARHYPDPFVDSRGLSCALDCEGTLGPCYAATIERQDISEGRPGLPVRLEFLVVDESCTPMPGISVDIWHVSNTGFYSGDDTGLDRDIEVECDLVDDDARASRYFRGVQTTDARGRVAFNSCYPGWYPGRAVHIHFILRRGGVKYVTSQLYFPAETNTDVLSNHPEYFGPPEVNNATDPLIQGGVDEFQVERQPDGVLLASKVLVMRSSLDDELCQVPIPQIPELG